MHRNLLTCFRTSSRSARPAPPSSATFSTGSFFARHALLRSGDLFHVSRSLLSDRRWRTNRCVRGLCSCPSSSLLATRSPSFSLPSPPLCHSATRAGPLCSVPSWLLMRMACSPGLSASCACPPGRRTTKSSWLAVCLCGRQAFRPGQVALAAALKRRHGRPLAPRWPARRAEAGARRGGNSAQAGRALSLP